jgi:hypothetical protein
MAPFVWRRLLGLPYDFASDLEDLDPELATAWRASSSLDLRAREAICARLTAFELPVSIGCECDRSPGCAFPWSDAQWLYPMSLLL